MRICFLVEVEGGIRLKASFEIQDYLILSTYEIKRGFHKLLDKGKSPQIHTLFPISPLKLAIDRLKYDFWHRATTEGGCRLRESNEFIWHNIFKDDSVLCVESSQEEYANGD